MTRVRYPRARFTRALEKICAVLEASPVRGVSHKDFLDRPRVTRVQARALWVAGSYARGALECGDLDLVLDAVGLDHGLPRIKDVARGFFGATPGVAFYGGTPGSNSSGVAFPEATLIWSADRPDWRQAIAGIAEDAGAGHFERPSDHLPLIPEQMRGSIDAAKELLLSRDAGLLRWHHIDFPGDHRSQAKVPPRFAEVYDRCATLGKATRHALAHFLAACEECPWADDDLSKDWNKRTAFRLGGARIHVGRPLLPVRPLESASRNRLVLVPHLTARGPNRAWVIERGPAHPLVRKAKRRVAYVLACSGRPMDIMAQLAGWHWVRVLGLFTARAAAESAAAEMDESDEEVALGEAEPTQVMALSGERLLESIARVDCLEIVHHASEKGKIFNMGTFDYHDADPHALFDELMALLPLRGRG